MSYIHNGNLDCAEEYSNKSLPFVSSTNISSQIPHLLEEIPQIRMINRSKSKLFSTIYSH